MLSSFKNLHAKPHAHASAIVQVMDSTQDKWCICKAPLSKGALHSALHSPIYLPIAAKAMQGTSQHIGSNGGVQCLVAQGHFHM